MNRTVVRFLLKLPVLAVFALVVFFAKEEESEVFDFEKIGLLKVFKKNISAAADYEKVNYVSSWSEIYDENGGGAGRFILTSPFCDDITGYGGSMSMAVIADENEVIQGVAVIEHRETPSWVQGLENIGFFNSWNGKTVSGLSEMNVEAVTGATYTSRAAAKIISKRAGIFLGTNMYESQVSKTELNWANTPYEVVLYIILFISLAGVFIKKLNKFRFIIQILSIIFFGIISGKFISIYFLESLSISGIRFLTSWTTVFLLFFSVIVPLILNRHFYCYYICPFGGAQTLIGKLPVKKFVPGAGTIRLFRALRLLIFISLMIAAASSLKIDLTLAEPFSIFVFSSASAVTIVGGIILLTASVFIKNPWCVYFCPTGQFFDLIKDGCSIKLKNNK